MAERITGHLDLRDSQKQALRDLREALARAMTDTKTALCGTKPDLATAVGRFAFAEKRTAAKLARLKAIEPKLQSFYAVLDDKQKVAFDEMRLWHRRRHGDGEFRRHDRDGDEDR